MAHQSAAHPGSPPVAMPVDAPQDYPFPKGAEGLMAWSEAAERLMDAHMYWLATTRPDGRPHTAPIWGAWVDDAFYFQGAPNARWARNLAGNPAASIHLESGTDVVIVDGTVAYVVTDGALAALLVDAWRTKYGQMEPAADSRGIFRLQPRTARAWGATLQDGARWTFATS